MVHISTHCCLDIVCSLTGLQSCLVPLSDLVCLWVSAISPLSSFLLRLFDISIYSFLLILFQCVAPD
ncbi:hypothetical protein SERLA73DRAFT_178442, partial [Serpula lacrymans var. lacrymans S7.3]